jgi:hypothetical protein
MKETITITKLPAPVTLNGKVAEYESLTSTFVLDEASATEVLVHSYRQILFDEPKDTIRARLQAQKADLELDKARQVEATDTAVVEIDKAIADINRLP